MTEPLLRVTGVNRSYPGVRALAAVDVELRPASITALLGENGAGKSTLIRILAGVERPDGGTMTFEGRPYAPASPADALRLGVSTLYQEQTLLAQRSVAANVLVGVESYRFGVLSDRRRDRQRTRAALDRVGASHIDPGSTVADLSTADRQMVDIARALLRDSRLLILDEPTAALSAGEVESLFAVLRTLPDQGVSVVLVSHRLDEVFRLCDDVVVLRDGHHVLSAPLRGLDADALVAAMVGAGVTTAVPEGRADGDRPVVLEARHLSGPRFAEVDLTLHAGEVLGVTGITGSGKERLAEVLAGSRPHTGGDLLVDGRPVRLNPRRAVRLGIAGVPEDRAGAGVIPALSVAANLALPSLPRLSRAGVMDRAAIRSAVDRQVGDLAIKVASPRVPVAELSGGNQQKVALGRWLERDPRVLVLVEPTQGIDVRVRYEFYRLIRRLADGGTAVVLVSSDLPEVLTLADRVLVLRRGRAVATLDRADATNDRLVRLSFGQVER